jgi:hypothetical protein
MLVNEWKATVKKQDAARAAKLAKMAKAKALLGQTEGQAEGQAGKKPSKKKKKNANSWEPSEPDPSTLPPEETRCVNATCCTDLCKLAPFASLLNGSGSKSVGFCIRQRPGGTRSYFFVALLFCTASLKFR